MSVETVDQAQQRNSAYPNQPASGPERSVSGRDEFEAAAAKAAAVANPAAPPAPNSRRAGARGSTQRSRPELASATPAPAKRPAAQPSNGARPASLAGQRQRALDQSLQSMKETQAKIKQELAPLTSDRTYLASDVRDMVASIDQKIADFDAHRKGAISDPRQMDAQIARAKAIQKEMQSLPKRVQTHAREFMEKAANTYDQAVRSGLNTSRADLALQERDWLSRHWFQKESIKQGRERVRVLAEMVPNLDVNKRAYLDAKGRGAPQAEIDKALVAYYSETVKAFNYDAQSGQEQLAATRKGINRAEQALVVTRVVRDGSFTVGAMLIPGAQGVGIGSGLAAVGALGLMKTGTHLVDEKPGGGSWTRESAGKALVTNTAGLGVDAASGLGYLKVGKEMLGATSMLQKLGWIGAAGGVSATSGTTHRLIDGKGTDGKKALFEFATGAITFGGTSKLAGLTPNMSLLPRLTLNAGVGAGTSVAASAAEQHLVGNGIDGATLLGAGLVGLGSAIAMTPRKANALSDPGPAPERKALGPAPEPVNAKAPEPAVAEAPPAIIASPAELANRPAGSTSPKMVLVVRGVAPNEAAGSLFNGAGEGRVNGLKGKNNNEYIHGFVVDPSSPFAKDAMAKAVEYANRGANLAKNGSATPLDDGGNLLVYRVPESSIERTPRHVEAGGEFSLAVRIPPGTKPIASLPAVSVRQPSQWLETFSKMASADEPAAPKSPP